MQAETRTEQWRLDENPATTRYKPWTRSKTQQTRRSTNRNPVIREQSSKIWTRTTTQYDKFRLDTNPEDWYNISNTNQQLNDSGQDSDTQTISKNNSQKESKDINFTKTKKRNNYRNGNSRLTRPKLSNDSVSKPAKEPQEQLSNPGRRTKTQQKGRNSAAN